MRELEVLGNGHLKLDFAEWKEFFETEMAERLRSQLKALIEQALEAERSAAEPDRCPASPMCPAVIASSTASSIT